MKAGMSHDPPKQKMY